MPDLRVVSDDGRLAEIIRLFDSGPDLIPVRDIGWLIDAAHERDRLRAALTEIIDFELEGDASLDDAMRVADEAINPPA
jgi:hypothetical protein